MYFPEKKDFRFDACLDKLFAIGILLFVSTIVIDWSVAKLGVYLSVLVALIGLMVGCKQNYERLALSRSEWFLFLVIFFLLIHSILAWYLNDCPPHGLSHIKSRQAKLLLFIPIYLFIRKRGFDRKWFCIAILLGVFAAGLDGVAEFISNDFQFWKRLEGGGQYTIRHALMTTIFVAIALSLILHFFNKNHFLVFLFLLGLILGLLVIFVSGTRGVWLALIAVFFLVIIRIQSRMGWKLNSIISLMALLIMVLIYQTPYVNGRINTAFKETLVYLEGGGKTSSIGSRLELWQVAWDMGAENPLFGVGPGGFNHNIIKFHEAKGWSSHLVKFEYPHNQYMAALATRGFIGLFLLILFLLIPLSFFYIRLKKMKGINSDLAFAGLLVVISFSIACLTYDHLEKRFQVTLFGVILALLMGILKSHEISVINLREIDSKKL